MRSVSLAIRVWSGGSHVCSGSEFVGEEERSRKGKGGGRRRGEQEHEQEQELESVV